MSSPLHQFFQANFGGALEAMPVHAAHTDDTNDDESSVDSVDRCFVNAASVSIEQDNAVRHTTPERQPQRPIFRREESYCQTRRRRKLRQKQQKQRRIERLQAMAQQRWCFDETAKQPTSHTAKLSATRQEERTQKPVSRCPSPPKIPRRRQSVEINELPSDALDKLTLSAYAA